MPFFENLAEGLSRAAGANDTADAIEKKKADRRATEHEELEGKTKGILDDVKTLQQRRASLPAGDPGIAEIDKALTAHQQAFRDLYHPIKNPGNLQKLGGFLQKHLTGKDPKPAPQSNEVTPERMAGLESSAAGTAKPAAPTPEQNPYALKVKYLEAVGLPHDEAVRIATGQKAPGKAAADGEPKPTKQTSDERARADFAEFKKTHPKYEGTFERWRKEQGTLPKVAGPAKPQRLSSAQNKAQSEYVESIKLSNIADQVASNPNDAVNQKRLAVSLERSSAGRFTTQALDYIIKAGWGNTIEQWANNPSTGALPKDVLRQLVDGAHQNVKASKAALDTAMQLSATIPVNAGAAKKSAAPKPSAAPAAGNDPLGIR